MNTFKVGISCEQLRDGGVHHSKLPQGGEGSSLTGRKLPEASESWKEPGSSLVLPWVLGFPTPPLRALEGGRGGQEEHDFTSAFSLTRILQFLF